MLTAITNKTKCDVRDCKNDADFQFATKGRAGRCFICTKCLAELTAQGATLRVPKSPKNTIMKKMELKSQEQNYDEK